jgi:hypothetical protein
LIAAAAYLVLRNLNLPPVDVGFVSSYGVVDNRKLLLIYAGFLMAVMAGPPLAALVIPHRWRTPPIPSFAPREKLPGGRRHVYLRLLVFGLPLSFFLIGPGVGFAPLNGHELVHLGYLNEINHGRVLNVDTSIPYGPLLGYSLWFFMTTFSFNLLGFRYYWNVLTVIALVALFTAAFPRFRNRGIFLVFAFYVVLHTSARYFLPDADGINRGFWGWANMLRHGWVPIGLLIFCRPLEEHRGLWVPILLGSLSVLGGLFAQATAISGWLALASLTVLSAGGKRFAWLRSLLLMILGSVITLGVLLFALALYGGVDEFLRAWWWAPRLFLQGAGNSEFPRLFTDGAAGVLYHLVPAVSAVILLAQWVRILQGERRAALLFSVALYACLSYVSVIVRADTPHLLNGLLPHLLALFLFVDQEFHTWGEGRVSSSKDGQVLRLTTAMRYSLPVLLAIPLVLFRPGLGDLALGFGGRITHPVPSPPEGWERIPGDRAGIWTSTDNWFDAEAWGEKDDPAAVDMIRRLTQGKDTIIDGKKASLYYFLADAPCALPYTDISSQCSTVGDQRRLREAFREARTEYIFLMAAFEQDNRPPPTGYRRLGAFHGFVVYQRLDLSPVDIQ